MSLSFLRRALISKVPRDVCLGVMLVPLVSSWATLAAEALAGLLFCGYQIS